MRRIYLALALLSCAACSGRIGCERLACPPPEALYAWIYYPAALPDGAKGFSCNGRVFNSPPLPTVTLPGFAFPTASVDPMANPDAVCWQSGPWYDGWVSHAYLYRQQFRRLHITAPGICTANGVPNGKCSMEGIRVCRTDGAGKDTPCVYKGNNKTGSNGCAPCELTFTAE